MLSSSHSENKPIISIQIASNEMMLLSTSGAKSGCGKNIFQIPWPLDKLKICTKYALERPGGMKDRQLWCDGGHERSENLYPCLIHLFKNRSPNTYYMRMPVCAMCGASKDELELDSGPHE